MGLSDNSFDVAITMRTSAFDGNNQFIMEGCIVRSKFYVIATSVFLATAPSLALAQSAPAGTCQFFTDSNYRGQGGQYPSGQGSYLMQQSEVPAALKNNKTTDRHQMFNSPELASALSSVRVGPGCMAGWVRPVNGQYGFSESRSDVPNFSDTDNQAVAVYCTCN